MKKFTLFTALLLMSFLARADWNPGPSDEVIFVLFLGILVGVFFASAFAYWLLNSLLSKCVTKKIRFPWVQSAITVALIAFLLTSRSIGAYLEKYGWEHGTDARENRFVLFVVLCMTFAWIVGFVIAPRKKINPKDSSESRGAEG